MTYSADCSEYARSRCKFIFTIFHSGADRVCDGREPLYCDLEYPLHLVARHRYGPRAVFYSPYTFGEGNACSSEGGNSNDVGVLRAQLAASLVYATPEKWNATLYLSRHTG